MAAAVLSMLAGWGLQTYAVYKSLDCGTDRWWEMRVAETHNARLRLCFRKEFLAVLPEPQSFQ